MSTQASIEGEADLWRCLAATSVALIFATGVGMAAATTVEFNSGGGTNSTNGLHVYVEDTSHMQVRRLNNTGQVYSPTAVPPSTSLDNGIFMRANGLLYGPDHNVTTFAPDKMFDSYTVTAVSPPNPSSAGVQQTATQTLTVNSGPVITVAWSYTNPYDFITANVTVVIPSGYAVSAANPVRYYHIFDTYLGGTDNGCGVTYTDSSGNRVVGTYPPISGSTCPSSSSVPSGVSVVESFRERSGLKFSEYCTAGWADFWNNTAGRNCYVKQAAPLSNTITTTYIDTGIGIEYDFTAAGTYTFSYDFVVGSPSVPPFDHLELTHDGSGTLCPDTVTVLGCLSSTVPCPSGSALYSALTGTLTPSGGSPAVTWAPATFSIPAGGLQTTATVQVASPGGTITLGASGLSAIPLNGVKCWNTATSTASCSFTAQNVSCFADDMDACSNLVVGTPARCAATGNRLYTKIAGQSISFDLVALKNGTPNTVDTGFSSGTSNPVKVDLVANGGTGIDATHCPNTPVAVAGVTAQQIDFAAGRPATATSFTVPASQNTNAYRDVRVRITQTSGSTSKVRCSADNFSIRPAALSLAATTNSVLAAGKDSFTLTASGSGNYDGTPKTQAAGLAAHANAITVGTISGNFSAAAVSTGQATGSFTYDEVGNLTFKGYDPTDGTKKTLARGISDTDFAATAGDIAGGDCSADYSNTADTAGRVGCYFGLTSDAQLVNATTTPATVVRFRPDHFDTVLTPMNSACAFSYARQPFQVQVTAKNGLATPATTKNYDAAGGFSKPVNLTEVSSPAVAGSLYVGGTAGGSGAVPASAFGSGVGTVPATATVNPSPVSFGFTSAQTRPTSIQVHADDADTATSTTGAKGSMAIYSGRVRLLHANGSELLDLPMTMRGEYWKDANNGWALNTADTCTGDTSVGSANAVTIALTSGTLAAANTCVWDSGSPGNSGAGCSATPTVTNRKFLKGGVTGTDSNGVAGFAGNFDAWLKAPCSGTPLVCYSGYLSVTATVPTWLQFPWTSGTATNPTARATFGVYKSGPVIHRREMY